MHATSHRHNHTVQETDQPTHAAEEQQKEHQKGKKKGSFYHSNIPVELLSKQRNPALWKICAVSGLWSLLVQPVPCSKQGLCLSKRKWQLWETRKSQENWIPAIKNGKDLEGPTPSGLDEAVAQRCPGWFPRSPCEDEKLFYFKDEAYFILILFQQPNQRFETQHSVILIMPKGFAPSTNFCTGWDTPKPCEVTWVPSGQHKPFLPRPLCVPHQWLYLFLAVM